MPGTDQRSLSGDGRGPPTNDEWFATNVEVQELAAANPAVAPHSCSFCREWELDLRQDDFGNITQRKDGETQSGFNLSYAREMAGTGCPFFERSLQLESEDLQMESDGMTDDAVVSVLASDLDSEPKVSIHWNEGRYIERSAVYEVYLPHDIRPSIDLIAARVPPNLVPNSSLSYRRVKGWIDDCSSNHVKCSSRPRDFMPSRVLHISGTGEEPTIRLSKDHPPAPYVVLSYCWGAEQPAKTTRANLSSYLSNIDVSTLSATVRDAAIVTRGIGMSYLWVDAMCIIQDDFDDVMEQTAQMHSIYHSSWVTIAAVEAPTCNHGFLQPRAQWQPLRMRVRLDGSDPSDVLLAPKNKPFRRSALFQRGWTMQEMLLSSRILLYGQRELVYLCLEAERCEGGVPSQVRRLGAHYDPVHSIYSDVDHPSTWGRVVVSYSQRLLSVDDDRLLAVGALAEAYGRNNGVSGYAAGMWREDFLHQCLWTTDRFAYDGEAPRHPSVYTAPSWSWASIIARIRMFGFVGNVPEPEMGMLGTMPPNITCEVVDIRTTLVVAGNPFGMVTDGELVIRGKLRQVVWESGDLWRDKGRLAKDAGTDRRMLFTLDCPHDWSGADDVLLWSLELCEPDDGYGYALLLQEAGHPAGLFQRVGLLGIAKMQRLGLPNWFESEHELREITII